MQISSSGKASFRNSECVPGTRTVVIGVNSEHMVSSISERMADNRKWLRPRGSNQIGMRQFNERVVLQAIRFHGSLPKAEIARLTSLSTQTVSLIINRLLDEELVIKLAPLRGRVGQPSVPIALNPDGAFSIGIKVGRRSLDVLLVDFIGHVRERSSMSYVFPDPDALFDEIGLQLQHMHKLLGPGRAQRLSGIGIAAPLALGGWRQHLGITAEQAGKWQRIDIRERVQRMTELPVAFAKDTAAACVAELISGRGRSVKSFLYVFIGTLIGGGLVIDSRLRGGLHGNAGALASIPLRLAESGGKATPAQLLRDASLFGLEGAAGLDDAWMDNAARAIALAINNATCLLDLDKVIIDGSCDRTLLEKLLAQIEIALGYYSWEGVTRPEVLAGTIGSDARAIGGALLPLYANFAPDHALFFKQEN